MGSKIIQQWILRSLDFEHDSSLPYTQSKKWNLLAILTSLGRGLVDGIHLASFNFHVVLVLILLWFLTLEEFRDVLEGVSALS
jgi:hypothetical protein